MMNSPFPGMDPYLEQHWRSVHHRLITYMGDQLQALLPPQFRVEVEERVFVSGDVDGGRFIAPDVLVTKSSRTGSLALGTDLLTSEHIVIQLDDEPLTEGYLEIIDTSSGEKVVTAIELLSPTNKIPGDGNELYIRKQREDRLAKVNQVEIDLTRSGNRDSVLPMSRIPVEYRATYLACVRRGETPLQIEAYPIALQQALPTLAIPLGRTTTDVPLDLQSAVTRCYTNGRYDDIDYTASLNPSLNESDADWARKVLADRRRSQ